MSILRDLESKSAADVCRENNIHPVMLSCWKKGFVNVYRLLFDNLRKIWQEVLINNLCKAQISDEEKKLVK